MNSITQHEDDEEKAKARLLASFDYLLNHNGSGHLEVNTKILKRGQKEVTIQCSRCHRFIVDMKYLTFTSQLTELVDVAVTELENEFLMLETVCEDLKVIYLKNDDEASSRIVGASELGAINSSDIVPVFKEFKNPRHQEFAEPTRDSLLNAFTETIKKYTLLRVDQSYLALNRCFGLDGNRPELW